MYDGEAVRNREGRNRKSTKTHRESNFSLKKVFRLKAAQLGNYRINVEWASGILGNIMAFKTSKKLIIWLKEDFFFIRS